jgi:hypothetical protein
MVSGINEHYFAFLRCRIIFPSILNLTATRAMLFASNVLKSE